MKELLYKVENFKNSWANSPTCKDLIKDYEGAKRDHDTQAAKISHWLDLLNVTGDAKPKTPKGRSSIQPKLIKKQNEWRYSSLSEPLLSTKDLFNVSPITFEDAERAVQNELLINNQFNTKIDKVKFIDELIRTAVNEGTTIVKSSWDYLYKEIKRKLPIYDYVENNDPNYVALLQQYVEMKEKSPSVFAEQPEEVIESVNQSIAANAPIEAIIVRYTDEIDDIEVIKNQPNLEVCDYRRIIPDMSCNGDITKARFVIEKFETSYAELLDAGIYKNLEVAVHQADSPVNDPDFGSEYLFEFDTKDKRKKVTAYEYWGFYDVNGDGELVPIVATWIGKILIRLERSSYPDGEIPYTFIPYNPVKGSLYGEPDAPLLEDNQKTIGALSRGIVDVMARSANGQIGYAKGVLDPLNKARFVNGNDYEWNMGAVPNPDSAFHVHKYPELPQSVQIMLQMQNNEAESMTGVKAFSGGISGQALGNTATAVRSALDATSKRELVLLNRIASGLTKIARKVMAMNAVWLSEKEVVRVTNKEYIQIRRDDLKGNFDLTMSISTAEADEQKAQELAFMLQTTGQSIGNEFSQMIIAEIARLRKMPELAEKILNFNPQPDPIEQEARQLENDEKRANIAEKMAQAKMLSAQAELHLFRANTEGAKARNLESDTDLKDLSFVEQETGTNHERAKELQKEGNKDKLFNEMVAKSIDNSSESDTQTTNGMRPT